MKISQAVRCAAAAALVMTASASAQVGVDLGVKAEVKLGGAKKPADMTVADIQDCMRKNLVDRAALRDLSIAATDREGKTHALKVKVYWKPTARDQARVNLRLVEPLAVQGSSYLLLQKKAGEEVWFYLPGADRAIRISGQSMNEPLWNTDFSYGEIKQVLGLLVEGKTTRGEDTVVGNRAAYSLTTELDADSGYTKVVSAIDQATCVMLRSNFFGKGETAVKTLDADLSSMVSVDAYTVVLGYTMRNVSQGSKTVINLSDFTLLERMPERLFEPQHFFEPFE